MSAPSERASARDSRAADFAPKRGEVTTIAPERPETAVRAADPGYRGFLRLAEAADLHLEAFQRRIARAVFDGSREALILLPRSRTSRSGGRPPGP
jgi:hypothetical protein